MTHLSSDRFVPCSLEDFKERGKSVHKFLKLPLRVSYDALARGWGFDSAHELTRILKDRPGAHQGPYADEPDESTSVGRETNEQRLARQNARLVDAFVAAGAERPAAEYFVPQLGLMHTIRLHRKLTRALDAGALTSATVPTPVLSATSGAARRRRDTAFVSPTRDLHALSSFREYAVQHTVAALVELMADANKQLKTSQGPEALLVDHFALLSYAIRGLGVEDIDRKMAAARLELDDAWDELTGTWDGFAECLRPVLDRVVRLDDLVEPVPSPFQPRLGRPAVSRYHPRPTLASMLARLPANDITWQRCRQIAQLALEWIPKDLAYFSQVASVGHAEGNTGMWIASMRAKPAQLEKIQDLLTELQDLPEAPMAIEKATAFVATWDAYQRLDQGAVYRVYDDHIGSLDAWHRVNANRMWQVCLAVSEPTRHLDSPRHA